MLNSPLWYANAAYRPAVPKVVICIASYRRPVLLKALLKSLDTLVFTGPEPEIEIVVVDNDSGSPLEESQGPIQAWSRHKLTYVVERVRGVAAARNRALAVAPGDADFIAFIDDDEQATPHWLDALLQTQAATGAVAVQGPVLPSYESTPPDWIEDGRFFELGPYQDGQEMGNFAGTNNALVSKAAIDRLTLRFDMRFNLTGGEDQDFFDRLASQSGGRIVASSEALVHDAVPEVRMNLGWILRRWYRMGNTLGTMALLRRKGRGLRFAKGFGWIGYGLARSAGALFVSRARIARGLAQAAFGVGMLSAYLRLEHQEYSAEAVAAERKAARVAPATAMRRSR
ncbi:MAG: glycosyltransferase family 2 protein [Pseudomonadota bacterium]